MEQTDDGTMHLDGFYTTQQLITRAAELYDGLELTVAQITTGLKHEHLSFRKVGNARLYPQEQADRWLHDWVEPSKTRKDKVRVRHMLTGPKPTEAEAV